MALSLEAILEKLRQAALAYPGAHEDHPWGETVVKVARKVFIFLGKPGDGGIGFSVKLPASGGVALALPFCQPTGYGLGKSGWVSATFKRAKDVPVDMVLEWIDESYRAIAPKTMVKALDAGATPPEPPGKPRRHRGGAS